MIGYTWERDIKGIVYNINPLDTLDNVIKQGNAFVCALYEFCLLYMRFCFEVVLENNDIWFIFIFMMWFFFFPSEIDGLNWLQRINVIHELAMLLKFIHDQEKQNMVLNISASHILLDKVSLADYHNFFFERITIILFFAYDNVFEQGC